MYAGYQFDFASHFNLGVEGFGDLSSAKSTDFWYGPATTEFKSDFGLRVLPGYMLGQNANIHAIVGYTRGQFKATDQGYYNDLGYSFSKNFSTSGYQVGLGTSYAFTSHLGMRLDYIYSGYRGIQMNGVEDDNYRHTVSTGLGLLSVNYLF